MALWIQASRELSALRRTAEFTPKSGVDLLLPYLGVHAMAQSLSPSDPEVQQQVYKAPGLSLKPVLFLMNSTETTCTVALS